jgi:hypothetical protein
VPDAQVKATKIATSIEHTTLSTSDGLFAFQDLTVGTYNVTVTAAGFPIPTFVRKQSKLQSAAWKNK